MRGWGGRALAVVGVRPGARGELVASLEPVLGELSESVCLYLNRCKPT